MASIVNDPNGRKRLLFIDPGGQRRTVRLGKLNARQCETIKTRVEIVVGDLIAGRAHTDDVTRWLHELDGVLRKRFERAGLVAADGAVNATLRVLGDKFFATANVKPGTATTYGQARDSLYDYFGEDRPVRKVTNLEADEWRQSMKREGLAEATISKRVKVARQMWKRAIRWKMTAENPFADVKAGSQKNKSRAFFVTRETAYKILDACPDAEWRLIFALSRFGGLRCPSEHLGIKWQHVDWENGRLLVHSPKTEHNEGGDTRTLPLFPELRPYLLDVFEQAEPGTEYAITRYRKRNSNLRTQLNRIIRRAGLDAWPRLFHNLRSTRQTELCEDFPTHVVCAWLGNTEDVALDHYLQVTDAHFERAIADDGKAAHKAAQQPAENGEDPSQPAPDKNENPPVFPGDSVPCESSQDVRMTPAGFEPASPP
jgi:integrase